MLLKMYDVPAAGRPGRDMEIWEIARRLEASKKDGIAPLEIISGNLPDLFRAQGLEVEYNTLPWKSHWATAAYLVSQLSQGRPVFIGTYAQRHALVAVGFDNAGVYLHDPSGAVTHKWSVDSRELAQLVPWRDFYTMCNGWPDWVFLMTVTTPLPVQTNSITIALMPDQLMFEHPPLPSDPKDPPLAAFEWEGKPTVGSRYQSGYRLLERRDRKMFHEEHATNSDKYQLAVNVSSTGGAAQNVSVTATLGGEPFGKVQHVISPGDINVAAELASATKRAPMPKVYEPGTYPLKIEAKVGNAVVDTIELNIDVGPSQVKGLRYEQKDKETWLCWDPAPEKGIEYSVLHVRSDKKTETQKAKTTETRWRVPAELASGKDSGYLSVVAWHNPSSLMGPPSTWLPLHTAEPELVGLLAVRMGDSPSAGVRANPIDDKLSNVNTWRYVNKGSIIRIDSEEMELTSEGAGLRYVDRGVNGTAIQPHAQGAKIYVIKRAEK
jgi:hypothetical protein